MIVSGKRVRVVMPGACGELVQGFYQGQPCLVSCIIDRNVDLELFVSSGSGKVVAPGPMSKTRAALTLAAQRWGCEKVNVQVRRIKGLPESKGYASSTADILASLFALARAVEQPLSAMEATRIALEVEPTDSLAWGDLTLLGYQKEGLIEPIGRPPCLKLLVLDWGGRVDTLAFNRRKREEKTQEPLIKKAFELLRLGIQRGDVELIGLAATLSAQANQARLYKPQLESVLKLTHEVEALGVCVAHSGSLIGILLRVGEAEEQYDYILRHLPGRPEHDLCTLARGGPRYCDEIEALKKDTPCSTT